MMLCTKCQQTIKPVIALDIDGTMGKYHEHFLNFASHWLGQYVSGDYYGDISLADFLKIDKKTYRECKLAYRMGGMKRSMPIMSDYVRGTVSRLSECGAEIWITTTRPFLRLDNIDPDTRAWLERNGIRYDHLLYDEHKYARLAEYVGKERIVAILDDLSEDLMKGAELGLPVYQLQTSFNSKDRFSEGFDNFHDVKTKFMNLLKEWKFNNVTK